MRYLEDSQPICIGYTEEEQHPGRTAMSTKNHNGLGSMELRQGTWRASKIWKIWSVGHKAVNDMKG